MNDPRREDAAWVRIPTGLARTDLLAFCQDVERLLRINSLYEFQDWRPEAEDRFFWRARNLANGCTIETVLRVDSGLDGVRVTYESGLKTATDFHVETLPSNERIPSQSGAMLVVTDDYSGTPQDVRLARGMEVDTSLLTWGRDLQRYLSHWQRWSTFGPWRWYMRRVWQPMRPFGRRVVFILVVIAVIEMLLTLLAVLGFFFFRAQ